MILAKTDDCSSFICSCISNWPATEQTGDITWSICLIRELKNKNRKKKEKKEESLLTVAPGGKRMDRFFWSAGFTTTCTTK